MCAFEWPKHLLWKWPLPPIHHVFNSSVYYPPAGKCYHFWLCTMHTICIKRVYICATSDLTPVSCLTNCDWFWIKLCIVACSHSILGIISITVFVHAVNWCFSLKQYPFNLRGGTWAVNLRTQFLAPCHRIPCTIYCQITLINPSF